MNDKNVERITPQDIADFSNKLAAWGRSLGAKEGAILQLMLDEGAGEGPVGDAALDQVKGGMRVGPGSSLGGTVFAKAKGTWTQTNTNNNGCHDTDKEWDYSPGD